MFGYGNKNQAKKLVSPSNNKTSLLYYKVGIEEAVTNFQAWRTGWKEHNITEYDVFFQEGRREYKTDLEYQPLLTISNNFLVPTA
jgi:hypothetical protein